MNRMQCIFSDSSSFIGYLHELSFLIGLKHKNVILVVIDKK